MPSDFLIFSGSSNEPLSAATAAGLGFELGACSIERHPDGEIGIEIEEPVRGRDVFIIQSTCPPVDEHLLELLAFADACRRASTHRIVAVIPYFGYARSDRRNGRREPIAASMVASLMQAVGIDHVVTVDVHTQQVEGFFQIPLDGLTAVPSICSALRGTLPRDLVVVAPDAGRVPMATYYAERLDAPLVVMHKRRSSGGTTHTTHVVGDVRGRHCLIVDDMISTGGTLLEAIRALREHGGIPEMVATTHALLVGDALPRLAAAGVRRLVCTDSVPVPSSDLIDVVSIAPVLAAAVMQIGAGGSLSALDYDDDAG